MVRGVNFFRTDVYAFRKSYTFDLLPFLETRSIGIIWSRTGCERNANVVRTRMTGKRKVTHTLLPSYGHVQDDREMVA